MKELIESCRKSIEEGRCLGCTALEQENFVGNYNCKYSKTQSAEESIKQIKLNLRNGEKMINSKQKGKKGELYVVNKFKENGYDCNRTAQFKRKYRKSR